MSKKIEVKVRRVGDANFNRVKEALRVCEDVCRFVYDHGRLARAFKDLRHDITDIMGCFCLKNMILARDIQSDVGRPSIAPEMRRKTIDDILFANLQRAKESLRVLEEFSKLSSKKSAERLKGVRYRLYHLERAIMKM